MAKHKRSQSASSPAQPAVSAASSPAEEAPGSGLQPDRLFTIKEYLLLNIVFDAFCVLQLGLVSLFLRETRGVFFFFCLLMAGFFVVSVFDYLYDRVAARQSAGQE